MVDSSVIGDSMKQPLNASAVDSILENLMAKMAEVLSKAQSTSQSSFSDSSTIPISIKLDGSNYALWSQVAEMYILGKDKLGYIDRSFPPPMETGSTFRKQWSENTIVKRWLINSMDPLLVGNFIRFPTAKGVWDSIATTYFDGSDTSQVYDLRHKVTQMWQKGESIEKYYNDL